MNKFVITRAADPRAGNLGDVVSMAPYSTLRILVVDDNLDQVHSLAFLLKDDGHEVDFAINATVAIEVARRMQPEVILLDIGLPDGSGLKVAPLLRLVPRLAEVRIIAVTGRVIAEEELRAAGFDDVLRKPVAYADLRGLLARKQRRSVG